MERYSNTATTTTTTTTSKLKCTTGTTGTKMFRLVLPLLFSLLFSFSFLPTITNAQCVITVSSEGNCPTTGECQPTIHQALTTGLLQVSNSSCSGSLTVALADPTYNGPNNCRFLFDSNNTQSLKYFSLISTAAPSTSLLEEENESELASSGSGSGSGVFGTTTTLNCTGSGFHLYFSQPAYSINLEGINFVEGTSENTGAVTVYNAEESVTMTNCRFYLNQGKNGAGAYLLVNNSVSLNNVVFDENAADDHEGLGGGLFLGVFNTVTTSATFSLNYTRFKGNTASSGGGLYLRAPQSVTTYLTNFTVTSNHATTYGGGAYLEGSFNINEISMRTNKAKYGGGMAIFETWGHIEQGTIHNNTVSRSGGGVYFSSTNVELKEIQIFGNSANEEGGGVYMYQAPTWRSNPNNVDNSIFKQVEINNNQANGYGGGAFINDSISDWQGVLFMGNQGKPQEGYTIEDSDVYCTPVSQNSYCTRCSCRDQCSSCSSQGCSLISEDSCICYVELTLEDACNNYNLPSESDSGPHHNGRMVLGLVFGLLLPLILIAVIGTFLFFRWRKRQAYHVLDGHHEETSNLIHPL